MNLENFEIIEKVPTKSKLAYGFSQAATNYISGIGLGVIDIFYLKVLGADPALLSISWFLFIIWNMINDPLIGILQDKTKTNKGRRIPYLRYGPILYVLSFIWIWFPFASVQEMLFWNHLLMLFIFDTMFSMMGLIHFSLPAEMTVSSKERGNIMIYATILGSIAVAGTILVPLLFLGDVPDVDGFRITMVITGIISGVIIHVASYFIRENQYTILEESLGFFESIKVTFKNKPFLVAAIVIFASTIMTQVIQGYFIFLFDYIVDIRIDLINIILFLILVLVIGYSVFWLMSNIEKQGLKKLTKLCAMVPIPGFVFFLIMGIILQINQFNKAPFWLLFLPLLTLVFGILGFMLLSSPILADCIDYDEVVTGKRRETTYGGVNALLTKPAVSIGRALFLLIIAIFGYQVAGPGENPLLPAEQALSVATGIIVAFTLIPAVSLAVCLIFLNFYSLDGEEWAEQKNKLKKIHDQKEKEFLEYLKKQ